MTQEQAKEQLLRAEGYAEGFREGYKMALQYALMQQPIVPVKADESAVPAA